LIPDINIIMPAKAKKWKAFTDYTITSTTTLASPISKTSSTASQKSINEEVPSHPLSGLNEAISQLSEGQLCNTKKSWATIARSTPTPTSHISTNSSASYQKFTKASAVAPLAHKAEWPSMNKDISSRNHSHSNTTSGQLSNGQTHTLEESCVIAARNSRSINSAKPFSAAVITGAIDPPPPQGSEAIQTFQLPKEAVGLTGQQDVEEKADTDALEYVLVEHDDDKLQAFVRDINQTENGAIDLYLDAEGGNGHGRNRSLNTIQVRIESLGRDYLVDVKALRETLFDTAPVCETGRKQTFRQILEDPDVPKIFFDVRADSDSIYFHFKIHMRGVIDLQIMELAVRDDSREYRWGLETCIENLPPSLMPNSSKNKWTRIKRAGQIACSSYKKYAVFDERPLPKALQKYAVNDAMFMPVLYQQYYENSGLKDNDVLWRLVLELSEEAVTNSTKPNDSGNTHEHRRGPQKLKDLYEPPQDDYDYGY